MKSIICIDTNIIIRFLQADHPDLSPKAREIILGAESGKYNIYFDEVMIAETVWVLTSHYAWPKIEVVKKLHQLISRKWAINPRKNLVSRVLKLYSNTKLSYIDCWISEVSKTNKLKFETFDKDLRSYSR